VRNGVGSHPREVGRTSRFAIDKRWTVANVCGVARPTEASLAAC